MQSMTELLVEERDGWARLTINRPAQRNALHTALLGEIAERLGRYAEDTAIKAIVLIGAEGNFAAGADIGEIEHKTSAEAATDPRKSHWARIRAFPKPLIAAVDGFCLGGGFELALMADFIIAGETARFGLPETNLGLIPGAGGAQRLLALTGRARATRMVLMGEVIDGATAEAWGICAWHVTGSALPKAEEIAAKLAKRAPLAMMAAKASLIAADDDADALAHERAAFEKLLDSADKAEGISAFRAKRTANFEGR
jgi:enoyl-CoA hydratase